MEHIFKDDNFQREVLESDIPVLVDFYAEWCGPCRRMAPVIEQLAKDCEGKIKVGKLNVDNHPTTANAWHVMSVPTLVLFQNGEEKERLVGAVGKAALEKMMGVAP